MMKHLTLILLVIVFASCKGKAEKLPMMIEKEEPQKPQAALKIDSITIAKRLTEKKINQLLYFGDEILSIPFNYAAKSNNKSEFVFMWQLGDLEINSKADNYFSFGFTDQIKFRNDELSAGNMHLVTTTDKTAITLYKVKKQLTDIDEIYYADNESIIYLQKGAINTLFFKYLDDKKAFAVYVSFNDYLKFSKFKDVSSGEKLELAIEQLAFAKQFFITKKAKLASDWADYEKTLNALNLATINAGYEEVSAAVESSSVNEFILLKKMDIAVMNLTADYPDLWDDVKRLYLKKGVKTSDSTFPLFENIFGKIEVSEIAYNDPNSIIIKVKSPFDRPYYVSIVKTKIKGKPVILATKNIDSWVMATVDIKEMAYFYKDLFNHFGKL